MERSKTKPVLGKEEKREDRGKKHRFLSAKRRGEGGGKMTRARIRTRGVRGRGVKAQKGLF